MSRTQQEIEQQLDQTISTAITTPSASSYAEWRLWKSIFARAIWIFENILDLFRAEIEAKVQSKQPGSMAWYYDRVMEFQGETDRFGNFQGDTLVVENGILQYQVLDPLRRIIKRSSIKAANGQLSIKLAKELTATTYQPLTQIEILAFNLYIESIKYPGTIVQTTSLEADKLKYNMSIVYDPAYTLVTIQKNIAAKLAEFQQSLGFDDRVYTSKFTDKLMEAPGVVAVKVTSLEGYHSTSPGWTAIDIVYTLVSGYFNYDATSTATYINYRTL